MAPNKQIDPTIFYTKKMIKAFWEEREVMLYWDLHGHSCKKNTFMYGCEYEGVKEVQYNAYNIALETHLSQLQN